MNATSIMIGGIVPAIGLGLGTVLMRASIGAGASIPVYLAAHRDRRHTVLLDGATRKVSYRRVGTGAAVSAMLLMATLSSATS